MPAIAAAARAMLRRSVIAVLLCTLTTAPTLAQEHDRRMERDAVFFIGVSLIMTTLSTWVQARSHGTVWEAAAGGLVGTTLTYAGQRAITSGDAPLRLAGLQLTAVGTSVARNLARGDAPFAELNLPVFPLYVRIRPGQQDALQLRLSTMAVISAIRTSARYGVAPDIGKSLITGALVFPVRAERLHCYVDSPTGCLVERTGAHQFGVFAYSRSQDDCFTHELTHVTQDVRDAVLHAIPASDYALDHSGRVGRWIGRYIVVDAFLPLMLLNSAGGATSGCNGWSYYECEVLTLTNAR